MAKDFTGWLTADLAAITAWLASPGQPLTLAAGPCGDRCGLELNGQEILLWDIEGCYEVGFDADPAGILAEAQSWANANREGIKAEPCGELPVLEEDPYIFF